MQIFLQNQFVAEGPPRVLWGPIASDEVNLQLQGSEVVISTRVEELPELLRALDGYFALPAAS